jgi:hypothetical protein
MISNGLALDYLINYFYDKMSSYIGQVLLIDLLIIIIGDIVLILICLFVWRPYIKNLNSNIWRTKGMLSMIPIEVFQQNDNLLKEIMKGDLIKAVK